MKIEIHSMESIEALAKSPFAPHTALISICDSDAQPPKLQYRPEHILRLVFDDITLAEFTEYNGAPPEVPADIRNSDERLIGFLRARGLKVFEDYQAKQIAKFITKYKDETDLLICQCHFGQSRSAACAAAIREYFYGDGISIFADERYSPNKLVYKKVLAALRKTDGRDAK